MQKHLSKSNRRLLQTECGDRIKQIPESGKTDLRMEAGTMDKKICEMNNRELFSVLTGNHGPMAQYYLREMIVAYRKEHGENNATLEEMVRENQLRRTA